MRPKAFAIPSYQVDGCDVVEIYRKSKKAIEDARSGKGPSFLECKAYRWRAHAGAGDPQKDAYRKLDELEEWTKKDPLKHFEGTLIKENVIKPKEIREINEEIDKDISEAFEFAKKSPLPDKGELEKYLFG
jgi:pyruvate dehydrogenase E1 component alpha subunit